MRDEQLASVYQQYVEGAITYVEFVVWAISHCTLDEQQELFA